MKKSFAVLFCLLYGLGSNAQTPGQTSPVREKITVCAECIHKNLEFLASDQMRGRGSGTEDEHKAAEYIGGQLKAYGIQPAGDAGGFIQQVTVLRQTATAPPQMRGLGRSAEAAPKVFVYGEDFYPLYTSQPKFSGPLKKISSEEPLPQLAPGTVALITGPSEEKRQQTAFSLFSAGAAAALLPASRRGRQRFEQGGRKLPKFSPRLVGQKPSEMGGAFDVLELSEEAVDWLARAPEGTTIEFDTPVTSESGHTWNAVGTLPGTDPALQHAAILFSAHLDHLGVGTPVNGDNIYNGADDDASGTTAVLELARILGSGPKPKRTVIFALFGSEEVGGLGATYFRANPPVPLPEIAANLEFEMIGRPDSAVKADTVWLTGWERSNLGRVLAEHGAHLVGDPHPEQDFFARSDNYVLAKKGVVAQTISSYGLHKDYHQPSDDIAHIDFKHMDEAIGSLIEPMEWLVNSDFKPKWNEGGQP
jgi:aminopeptidase YwaD